MLKEYSGQKTLFQGLRSPVFLFIFQAFLKDRESEQEILDSVLKHHTVLDLTGDKNMTTKQNNSEFSRPRPRCVLVRTTLSSQAACTGH